MKWILSAALAGWCGIIALSWHLAQARIKICGCCDERCEVAQQSTRDALLIGGLVVALVLGVILARLVLIERERLNPISQAPRATKRARRWLLLR